MEHSMHKNHDSHSHSSGHMDHHKMMIEDFKRRFFLSLIITIPILILSPMIQDWLNISIDFRGSKYILLALASLIYLYGGWPFLSGLINELRAKSPGMMTLIAMAISVAYFYSVATVFGLDGNDFFWELASLIDIMLLGHWIEMKSVLNASNTLEKLAQLLPDSTHLIKDGQIIEIKTEELRLGDKVLIKPGEKIPADGFITDGTSSINESMLTGESKPIKKIAGSKVIGGSINGDGALEVEISSLGEDSFISKVINMVGQAQGSKSRTQNLADRAAFWLTIIALVSGFATLFAWYRITKDISYSIARMASVMVITCPHALGLAIPLVVASSTAQSAQNGLLIRNRNQFENSRKIDTLVFDKTGTLTQGAFTVDNIEIFDDSFSRERIVQYAASLESHSEHPIANGIIKEDQDLNIPLVDVSNFQALKGKGVEANIDNQNIKLVSPGYLKENNISIPNKERTNKISTQVFLLVNNDLVALISLSDKIRDESYTAIKKLKEKGIKLWMLTGDNKESARYVSEELKLDGYFAEVLPDQKQEKIKELQSKGYFVAMTGDGINDAPALAQADVGIAIGSGTDIAAETADIILVNSNPEDLVSLINFGKATYKKMIQNLIYATAYNVLAIPLAAGLLSGYGIVISPALGAILMSLSTIIVAINAKFLKLEKNA